MYCFKNENENPSVDFLPNNYLTIKIVISMQDKFYCVTKWKETEQSEAVRITPCISFVIQSICHLHYTIQKALKEGKQEM